MRAVRIHEHGDPSVLRLDDLDVPKPGAGQVLCKVLAVSVNHLDLWVRRGMPGFKVEFPRILGCDGTAEVVECGSGVEAFKPGQKVVLEPGYTSGESPFDDEGLDHFAPDYEICGEHGDGYDAEYVVLDERYLCPLPDGLDPVRAAAVPLVFLTAWGMLERAQVVPGETVLVIAGSSGVGSAAIQIAGSMGARVIATAGSDEKRQLCADLGADEVIDHYDEQWPREVKRVTDGDGADVVVEHVGPATWSGSMRSLARLGRIVTCGATTGPTVDVTLPHLFIKNQAILGSTMGPASALPVIFDRVARGHYRPVLDQAVPMSEVRAAHERLESHDVVGKVVLLPGE